MKNWSHAKLIGLLLFISYIMLMAGNGLVTLTHPDEVFYIQTAKEMIARQSWMVPYIFDAPQFEKPIFTYWLLIVAMKIFGPTAFAARFVPAFYGIIGVVVTYWFSLMLFKNKRSAFLSGIVLASSFIYFVLSRSVLTDMVFSIWVLMALAFFYWGYQDVRYKNLGILLCFAATGLAVLSKGVLGIIFPALIIGGFLAYSKDLKFFKTPWVLGGIIIFMAIALPWHVAMIKMFGQSFIQEYWNNVHVRRIFDAEHQKSNTWYFYLMTIVLGIFPWSLLLVPASIKIFKSIRSRDPDHAKFVLLALWIAVVVIIMQIAQSKLASYIFPVFPAIAIAIGWLLDKMFETKELRLKLWITRSSCLLSIFLIGGVLFGWFYIRNHPTLSMYDTIILKYMFAVIPFSLLFLWCVVQKSTVKQIACHASLIVLMLILAYWGRGYAEPWVSCQQICEIMNKTDRSNDTILCSKFYVRGIRYFTDRSVAVIDNNGSGFFSPHPIAYLNSDEKIWNFLSGKETVYCIVKKSDREDIVRIVEGRMKIQKIEEIGGKILLRLTKI